MKPWRWFILGITLFFLLRTFHEHSQEIREIPFTLSQIRYSLLGLLVTLIAHIWSGIVWTGMIKYLKQPAPLFWVLPVYLKTNLAKYIPGNVWHFYGRIKAIESAGSNLETATLVTLLEPVLMATAAILITLGATQQSGLLLLENPIYHWFSLLFTVIILISIHPFFLNRIIETASKLKKKSSSEKPLKLQSYPLLPLLGEMIFVVLRGSGFIITLAGFTNLKAEELPLLLGGFSFSWGLGLIVPSPGGMGVFESSSIAILDQNFSPAILLSSLAIFRLISLTAEAIAAGLSWGIRLVINH